jgi:hypothetical protein
MAKKKARGKPMVESEARTPVRLDLTESMKLELRIAAARRGMPMAALVRSMVEEFLDAERKSGSK